MTPLKILPLVAILSCALPVLGGCGTEQQPAPEQAQVVNAPHEPVATPAAVETATVAQPQEQASPVAEVSPGPQKPPPPIASTETTTEEDSGSALSTIGEILTAPFRLVASLVGFIL
jgi:hypothetical protein